MPRRYLGGVFGDTIGSDIDKANISGVFSMSQQNYMISEGGWSGLDNYFGNGVDGDLSTTGNVTFTVQNKNGSYDGDMVVKQYTSLTVNSGHTITTDQPCRGMLIYVKGDCVINGKLSMSERGAAADPTASGGSDNSAVPTNGIQYGMSITGGTDSLSMLNGSTFNGCGGAAKTAVGNQKSGSGINYTIHTIPRSSSNGSGRPVVGGNGSKENPSQIRGGNAQYGSSACGGGGAGGQAYETDDGQGGAGGNSTCFSGGSGGGGAAGGGAAPSGHRGSDASANGGSGGQGGNHHESSTRPCGTGGAGNPGGPDGSIGTSGNNDAGDGTGGLLLLIVKGNLTIGGNGSIQANGNRGGDSTSTGDNSSMGGGSGGGHIMIMCAGNINGGGISAGNYVGQAGSSFGSADVWGVGVEYNIQAWGGRGGKNGNTSDCPQQDLYTGTSNTRQGGTGGKGLISIYTGNIL
tara:strand:- start:162 stop:1547 length:1386 start_codon:yes stop_codon:yes gene_type:complete